MATPSAEALTRILSAARWAPSGDNTQPWRFEPRGAEVIIHGADTRDWCVYDLEGRASQLALGALLETIAIAASREGQTVAFDLLPAATDRHPSLRARFVTSEATPVDPLAAVIEERSTQRRPLSRAALRPADRAALDAAPGPGYRVVWIEGARPKARMARLLFLNAQVRLSIPEAYEVHKRIIHWGVGFSEDRIPDRALGLNPVAVSLMKWAMQSWGRVQFLNRWFAGTLLPRIEMDVLPALGCAAHFFLIAERPPAGLADYLAAGRSMQRLWLTATARGLQFQPAMTPLIFANYVRHGIAFTRDPAARSQAEQLKARLAAELGDEVLCRAVFAGRLGYGSAPRWRSIRRPLESLLTPPTPG
ncbi:nitroreductase family protein [Candidatus Thiodictyon syntrophicum]|jgi:hypothetical protein|uniref:Nitroreductase domain-containing protein n=1 Tax=Candidatus Thiodictyon syntrophicum TaxID=1166950 RepID=A0A2K8U5U4_9GAMM|nr:nitroreductase family protein [Candidatus Thiodictyon syntrophicum]AUB80927.1 hypothetical protein THSYN_08170 [Candidatus Thiodictyon syntrophicum]